MPNREAKVPQIQFDKLGGLNERPALNATPAPDFAILHALYQKRAGSLQRLEGTRILASLPGTGVLGGNQLDDGTGNVVVQGENGTEYLYTLDELFGRSPVYDLTPLPLPDDNNMPTAILIQDAANGTDIADIGGTTTNTVYTRALTSNPINESGIVVAFVSGASASFEVAAGTYRIRGFSTMGVTVTAGAGTGSCTAAIGYQFAISDTTTSTTVATSKPSYVKTGLLTAAQTFGPMNITSEIDYTFTIAGPANSVLQVKNAFSSTTTATGTSVAALGTTSMGGNAADVTAVVNGAALRQPFVVLNLAKVS